MRGWARIGSWLSQYGVRIPEILKRLVQLALIITAFRVYGWPAIILLVVVVVSVAMRRRLEVTGEAQWLEQNLALFSLLEVVVPLAIAAGLWGVELLFGPAWFAAAVVVYVAVCYAEVRSYFSCHPLVD